MVEFEDLLAAEFADRRSRSRAGAAGTHSIRPKLLEALAAIEHERWAGWMRYQENAPE